MNQRICIDSKKVFLNDVSNKLKGQLISKCLFCVFNFFQNTNNSFVYFLEEFIAWKFAFEINRPLICIFWILLNSKPQTGVIFFLFKELLIQHLPAVHEKWEPTHIVFIFWAILFLSTKLQTNFQKDIGSFFISFFFFQKWGSFEDQIKEASLVHITLWHLNFKGVFQRQFHR